MSRPSINALPVELLVLIIDNLEYSIDVSALGRTSRRLYDTANPILYKRAAQRSDSWPLSWAAQTGVVNTLIKALDAGLDPNYKLFDEMPALEWERETAAAKKIGQNFIWGQSDTTACGTNGNANANVVENHTSTAAAQTSNEWDNMDDAMSETNSDGSLAGSDDERGELGQVMGPRPVSLGPGTVVRRYTPIHLAVRGGHKKVVEVLLDRGASISACSENFCNCSHQYGLLNATEQPEDDHHIPHWSPLHIAICHSRTDMARLLLSRGASSMMDLWNTHCDNRRGLDGVTALHHAAAMGLTDLIQHLVESKVEPVVDIRDDRNLTPLYHAYANSRWDSSIPLLLKLGANLNVDIKLFIPYTTITPLGEACRLGNFEEANRLIDLGADVTRGFVLTTNGGGLSPLHMCAMPSARTAVIRTLGSCEDEAAIPRMKTISKLVSKGADLNARDCYGDTPLIAAAQHCNVPAIKALLLAGADIHERNSVGRTPLMQAIMGPSNLALAPPHVDYDAMSQTLRELLNAGARINETDHQGNTVLHLPFRRPKSYSFLQLFTLRFFLNLPGIDQLFQVRDTRRCTPFLHAFMVGNLVACDTLLRKGCLNGRPDHDTLIAMFEFALKEKEPMQEALLEVVLDVDVDRYLTSDPSPFMRMFNYDRDHAVRALNIISRRGLPAFTPSDFSRILGHAIRMMELRVAYRLVDAGADVNAPDEMSGSSPLASFVEHVVKRSPSLTMPLSEQLLRALINRGANFNLPIARNTTETILQRLSQQQSQQSFAPLLKTLLASPAIYRKTNSK
ncbi:putative ankyrin repeat protein [Podospora fimiseda]|uniref:Ankyrin repeat protein n=1 Tax=Podospora fimiseda TaxID=252190 RepID=A0AAN7BP92_9PEZI|nr:putative ankyrin repeat protein [Podospora fimiseda]